MSLLNWVGFATASPKQGCRGRSANQPGLPVAGHTIRTKAGTGSTVIGDRPRRFLPVQEVVSESERLGLRRRLIAWGSAPRVHHRPSPRRASRDCLARPRTARSFRADGADRHRPRGLVDPTRDLHTSRHVGGRASGESCLPRTRRARGGSQFLHYSSPARAASSAPGTSRCCAVAAKYEAERYQAVPGDGPPTARSARR
jgi:hypothetical protein